MYSPSLKEKKYGRFYERVVKQNMYSTSYKLNLLLERNWKFHTKNNFIMPIWWGHNIFMNKACSKNYGYTIFCFPSKYQLDLTLVCQRSYSCNPKVPLELCDSIKYYDYAFLSQICYSFRRTENVKGAISGEHGGCGIIVVFFFRWKYYEQSKDWLCLIYFREPINFSKQKSQVGRAPHLKLIN